MYISVVRGQYARAAVTSSLSALSSSALCECEQKQQEMSLLGICITDDISLLLTERLIKVGNKLDYLFPDEQVFQGV